MENFEKAVGKELFAQISEKIKAWNGSEANKDKQVRLGNFAGDEYIEKGKYNALNDLLKGKETELGTANGLIAELKKTADGNEGMQKQIADYEAEVAKLREQLKETELKAAVKVALLSENVADVDYITFKLNEKLREKNEKLEVDDSGKIKHWSEHLADLKTQFPNMFTASAGGKQVIENRLPKGESDAAAEPDTLAEALKQAYDSENDN